MNEEINEEFNQSPKPIKKFNKGLQTYFFSESEMKIESKVNKEILVIIAVITVACCAISAGLALGLSMPVLWLLLLLPLTFLLAVILGVARTILIDLHGVTFKGFIQKKYLWGDIEKFDIQGGNAYTNNRNAFNIAVWLKSANGKSRLQEFLPLIPEIWLVIKHYFSNSEQIGDLDKEVQAVQTRVKATTRAGFKSMLLACALLFAAAICLLILQSSLGLWAEARENNTLEFSAVILQIENDPTLIFTDQHEAPVRFTSDTILNQDAIDRLSAGDFITYRVMSFEERYLSDPDDTSIIIVYFRIGSTQIVSFESYNERAKAERTRTWLLWGLIGGVLMLCGFALMCYVVKKKSDALKKFNAENLLNKPDIIIEETVQQEVGQNEHQQTENTQDENEADNIN